MPTARELAEKHWNETPLYYTHEYRYTVYPWLYEVAEFRRHSGERVLEIGCGTGSDLLQFALHGAEPIGVDVTDSHVALARERVGTKAAVIKADATALPFSDASFDYVYSHGVLHHIDEPRKVAREILRVLKPGGYFNLHVYALWSWLPLWNFIKHGRDWKCGIENSTAPVWIDLYTGRSMRRLFPGIQLTFSKYESHPRLPKLAAYVGWFLVAKAQKPIQ